MPGAQPRTVTVAPGKMSGEGERGVRGAESEKIRKRKGVPVRTSRDSEAGSLPWLRIPAPGPAVCLLRLARPCGQRKWTW